jgi:hypothetical protein
VRAAFAVASILLAQACNGCNDTTATTTTTTAKPDAQSAVKDAAPDSPPPPAIDAAAAAASFDDLPDAGTDLDLRAKHLLEAIAQNDASLAADIVLPREAFIAARDAQDPATLYDGKFKNLFAAHIARIHRHEKGIEQAVFVSFALGQNPQRVVPRKHDWKEPVWRAQHSTLTFTIDGRVHRIEIAEMIAWRGNWYVAHLK